jgi:hypothetical protein
VREISEYRSRHERDKSEVDLVFFKGGGGMSSRDSRQSFDLTEQHGHYAGNGNRWLRRSGRRG